MTDYRKNAAPPEPLRREPPVLQRRWRRLDGWATKPDNLAMMAIGYCTLLAVVGWLVGR